MPAPPREHDTNTQVEQFIDGETPLQLSSPTLKSLFEQKFSTPEEARHWAQMIALAPFAFAAAKALRNLGVLDCVLATPGIDASGIGAKTGLSDYALGVLLDAGETCGLLSEDSGKYSISPAGEFVAKDPMTRVNMDFAGDVCYEGLAKLETSLQEGKPAGLSHFGPWETIYAGLTELPPTALKSWLAFDHFYSDDAFPKALAILFKAKPSRILDVGANTGKFSIACANFDPSVKLTMLDHPKQLALAEAAVARAGLTDRVRAHPINLLDHAQAFPVGEDGKPLFDAIWMSQLLDCFSEADILGLIKRARPALRSGGSLYIMEPFTDLQRYEASRFCLDMTSLYFTALANGNSRMYRSSTFYKLLKQAEFKIVEEYKYVRLSQTILRCELA